MPVDLEKIQDSPHLLDILLQMEDVLDSLDVYCFKNWFKGEVVEGPSIRRYWLNFTLKYDYKSMPDPRGGLRLLKHGIRVEFEKAKEETPGVVSKDEKTETVGQDDLEPQAAQKTNPEKTDDIWLVHISMPRRLVSQIATSEMDFYDDEIDVDDVEDAKDSGIDDESEAYENPDAEQAGNGEKGGDETGDMSGGEEEEAGNAVRR
jgi:hypothetical protein